MTGDGIEIDTEFSGEDSGGDTSIGPVVMKEEYGTSLYRPEDNRVCEFCDSLSIGMASLDKNGMVVSVPICRGHKEKMESVAEWSHKNTSTMFKPWKTE